MQGSLLFEVDSGEGGDVLSFKTWDAGQRSCECIAKANEVGLAKQLARHLDRLLVPVLVSA
jgi:hypothetical protein